VALSLVSDKSRQRWIIMSVAFATFMSILDANIVNISLPTIARYFSITTGQVVWVTISYLLIQTSTLLFFGKIADRMGVNKIFISGYLTFVVGSLMCGISTTGGALIFSRCIQALGGAMLYTTTFAIIPKFIPAQNRGWAFGLLSTAAALGITVGAPLGGFITGFFSWHWIFLINIPIGLTAVLVALKVLPKEEVKPKEKEKFDFPGAILSFMGPLFLIYALNMGHKYGWGSPTILTCFAASALSFVALIIREKFARFPLLDLNLYKKLDFTLVNLSSFMAFAFLAGSNFLVPFYLQLERGLAVEYAGMVILVYSIVYMFVGPFAGRLSDKVRPRLLCSIAMFSATLASLTFAFIMGLPGLIPVILFLVWLAISNGFFISPNNSEVMSLVPADKQGIASGAFKTVSNLGMVIGVTLFEVIFAASIPKGITPATFTPDQLLAGFKNTYVFGSFILLLAFLFSIMARGKKVSPKAQTELLGEV